jgi:serine/threonine protein kinase
VDIIGRTLLGKYKVERLLGQGGMGSVWLGRHVITGRQVAIKVLDRRFLGTPAVVERFGREARSASAVQHEGIVEVLDLDTTEEGVPFLVMEFLEGESLSGRIERKGKLDEAELVDLGAQLCDALHAAHEAGVIHRDLKPDNIFVVPRGRRGDRVKILDFGISSKVNETAKLTVTGSVLGTPHYMSPEQAAGDGTIDRRADLYALGVVLYECAVGEVPFDAPNYNRLLRVVLEGKPVRPAERGARISPAVEEVILRAMALSPERRPASAIALKDELLRAQGAGASANLSSDLGANAPAATAPPAWDLDSLAAPRRPPARPRLKADPSASPAALDDLSPAAPAAAVELAPAPGGAAFPPQASLSDPLDPDAALSRSGVPELELVAIPRSPPPRPLAEPEAPPPAPEGVRDRARAWWDGLTPRGRRGVQATLVGLIVFVALVVGLRTLVRPEAAGESVSADVLAGVDPESARDWVLVEVDHVPEGAELRLDGLPGVRLPLRIRAGTSHTLEIRAPGHPPRRFEVRGIEGARLDVAMTPLQ